MHNFPWMWILFAMLLWVLFTGPRKLWACDGRASADEPHDSIDRPRRRANRADLESALAERDALIAKLEERVRVLERIATDDSARLRAEIDALRDPPRSESSS